MLYTGVDDLTGARAILPEWDTLTDMAAPQRLFARGRKGMHGSEYVVTSSASGDTART